MPKYHWYPRVEFRSCHEQSICSADESDFVGWLFDYLQIRAFSAGPRIVNSPYFACGEGAIVNRQLINLPVERRNSFGRSDIRVSIERETCVVRKRSACVWLRLGRMSPCHCSP